MDFQNFLNIITNSTGECICIFIFGISAGNDIALHIVSYFLEPKLGELAKWNIPILKIANVIETLN